MYGEKIATIRKARGYTQEYVASKLNKTQKEYSKIESNQVVKLDDSTLGKIAEILGVNIEDIKSTTPVIMHFTNSPNSGNVDNTNSNYTNLNTELLNELIGQIKI